MNYSDKNTSIRGAVGVSIACWASVAAVLSSIGLAAAGLVLELWLSSQHASVLLSCGFVLSAGTLAFSIKLMDSLHDSGLCKDLGCSNYLKVVVIATLSVLIVMTLCCIAVVLFGPETHGIPTQYPIMAVRQKYILNSHGFLSEVPRWEYLLAGLRSGLFGTCGASALALLGLYVLFFGRPRWMSRSKLRQESQERGKS